jgi:SlyX protein
MQEHLADAVVDLEVRIAYQDRVIADLDALVRGFATRLDTAERELRQLREALRSPELPGGPANEPPPHY